MPCDRLDDGEAEIAGAADDQYVNDLLLIFDNANSCRPRSGKSAVLTSPWTSVEGFAGPPADTADIHLQNAQRVLAPRT
jgi:hypothetical protein